MRSTNFSIILASSISLLAGCSFLPGSLTPQAPPLVQADSQTGIKLSIGSSAKDSAIPAGMGAFRVTVKWPDDPARSTQAIPTRTDHFVVTIQGSGIQPAITHTINRKVVSGTQTEQIIVPAGASRIVTVKAQNAASQDLATGTQSGVVITEGQFTPLTVTITSVVGNVNGAITNGDSGAAVTGALVQVDGTNISATTGANGAFTLLDVPAGPASITISGTGFTTTQVPGSVTVSADQTIAIATVSLPVAHWVRQLTGTQDNLYSVNFADTNSGWAVGDNNHILHTADGGKSWTEQFNKVISGGYTSYPRLFNVKFRDALNGWAVGAQCSLTANGIPDFNKNSGSYTTPIMVKTSDGGTTWTGVGGLSGSSYPLYDVALLPTSNVYVTGGSYSEYSTDNGSTWTEKTGTTGIRSFWVSSSVGFLVRTNGLYYTNTGGANWAILNIPTGIGNIIQCYFSSATNGSAITDTGKVIQTTDGGANWTTFGSAPAGTLFNSFHFNDQNFGYGVASSGKVYITSNGGTTWKSQTLSDGSGTHLRDAHFVDSTHGWVVGDNGRIYTYAP